MDSLLAYVDDPYIRFCWSTPNLSALEQKVIWAIDKLSSINGRISMSEIAKGAQASRRTVFDIVRRFRGRGIIFIGELGKVGIFRVDLRSLARDQPVQALHNQVQALHNPMQDSPDQPMQTLHNPPPGNVPALPEEDFKSFKNKGLNETKEVKISPPPSSSPRVKGGIDYETIRPLVAYFHELRGFKTNQPPELPAADLCFRFDGLIRARGPEKSRYLLLAHFHETRQQNSKKNLRQYDSLHHAIPWVKRNGQNFFREINLEWADERIEAGWKITVEKEKKAASQKAEREKEAIQVASEEQRKAHLDVILGRTRRSAVQ